MPELKVLTSGQPGSLDPASSTDTVSGLIIDNTYETLIFYQPESITDFQPVLATDWDVSQDKMCYAFRLRQGVQFHDGASFDAKAMEYAIRRALLMDQGPVQACRGCLRPQGVRAPDRSTLRLQLEHPYSPFIHCLTLPPFAAISPQAVEHHGGVIPGCHNEWVDRHCIGTGPFVLADLDATHTRLEANREYWGSPPHIDNIILAYAGGHQYRTEALLAGEADMADVQAASLDHIPRDRFTVMLNQSIDVLAFGLNRQRPPLDDLRLRRRIVGCFNRNYFLANIRKGLGQAIYGPVPHGLPGALVKAGDRWAHSPQDNVDSGADPDRTLTISFSGEDEQRHLAARLLQANLAKIGIRSRLEPLEWREYLARGETADFDIVYLSWAPDYADPDDFVGAFCSSSGQMATQIGFSNECLDQLAEAARREPDDRRRVIMYQEMQRLLHQDAVYIWLCQPIDIKVFRKEVQGIRYHPLWSETVFHTAVNLTD